VTEYAEQVKAFGPGELVERMGIEILVFTPERVVGRMPVAGNRQPYGLLHGGANVVLAETLGSFGAALHAGPERVAVGIEVSATHHRAVVDGHVTGVATPIALGRTAATYEIVITDDQDRRTCTARLTCLLRERPPA
jgi:1,4-dihydroxy-2-naphthoyl-CoA hydrolase